MCNYGCRIRHAAAQIGSGGFIRSANDFAQTVHELLKRALLLIMVAVADIHPAGMALDAGDQEERAQSRRGQRGWLLRIGQRISRLRWRTFWRTPRRT